MGPDGNNRGLKIVLPKALPDELLFSRLVRFKILTGLTTFQAQQFLLNNSRVSLHPFLPSLSFNNCIFGMESTDSLYRQTLGLFYQLGLTDNRPSVKQLMINGTINSLSRLWQLPNQKGQQDFNLKSCAKCADEDVKFQGVAYWHLSHQCPNVSACYKHQTKLAQHQLIRRHHLSIGLPPVLNETESASNLEVEYAQFCVKQLKTAELSSKEELLFDVNKHLSKLGYLTEFGRVKRRKLCSSFYFVVKDLNFDHSYFKPEGPDDYRFIQNILSQEHYTQAGRLYPFLFWLHRQNYNTATCRASVPKENLSSNENLERECIQQLLLGNSLNQTALAIGKSRTYVKSIALKENITKRLKPKRIDQKMRERILLLASRGMHREAIARKFDISSGSVELIISSLPTLVKLRKKIRFESKRRRSRVNLLRFLNATPNATRQDVFQACNQSAHWLLRNDKVWINHTLPAPLKPSFDRIKRVLD
tara:strand:+ start:19754 stop:21184 length:1431 start_codon:yes stop_codon:yes gene_type:complete